MHLYRVWRDMTSYDPKKKIFKVNLLLNKAAKEADVYSWMPNRGHVEIKPKVDCFVAVRIPSWAGRDSCAFSVNGESAEAVWDGKYGIVPAKVGQVIALNVPISEHMEKRVIMESEWATTIRGSTIVDIQPKGEWGAIHCHPEYRSDDVKIVRRERYVHPDVLADY